MAQPGTAKIPVGTVLAGKYRITREIGRGGMASVYEAENVDIGKRVAIKVLAQELISSSVVVERFLREARAAAAIRSPYICDVYDSGRLEDNRPFLVLELLEGESLFERLTQVPYLNIDQTLTIITQVCRGLTKAHAANIVHRDLKPENIFLTRDEDGTLLSKILDFGLAKFYAPMTGPEGKAQARLTREGAVFGTPAYMAPEQVRGQGAVDHRADLWALGCITYECLTGKTVWKTEQGVAMTFAQIAGSPLPDAAESRKDLPPGFKGWFERALARDLEKRFQTAKEFSDALAAAIGSRSSFVDLERSGRGPSLQPGKPSMPAPDAHGAVTTSQGGAPGEGAGHGRRHSFDSSPTTLARPSGANQQPEAGFPGPSGAGNAMNALPPFAMGGPPKPGAAAPSFGPPPQNLSRTGPPMERSSAPPGSGPYPGFGGVPPSGPRTSGGDAFDADMKKVRGGSLRGIVIGIVAALALGAGVVVGWQHFNKQNEAEPTKPTGSGSAGATAEAPSPSGAASGDAGAKVALPWIPLVRDAQQTLSTGDLKGAFKQLKEAFDKGGHGVPRTLLEHVQIGIASATGKTPCQLTGIARPRTYDLVGPTAPKTLSPAGRPSIVLGPKGPVMTWTDNHSGSEHAYATLLDAAMRGVDDPIDVTPDGASIARPEIMMAGDKVLLMYWEQKGSDPGVRARWLTADGNTSGASVLVGPSKARGATASMARASDGSLFAIWSNESEIGSEDLFLRRVSPDLEPQGEPARATDYIPTGAGKPKARFPEIAVQGDALHVAFRLERDPARSVNHMRLPIADAGKGLPAQTGSERVDRTMGETAIMNPDKSKAESPSIACSASVCFVVWHAEMQGGVSAAYIEHGKAQSAWHRKLSKGARPTVAVSEAGDFQVAWFEGGRVVTAKLSKDGLGVPTKLARVISDQPAPSVAAGAKPGEWYIAWLDYETGHLEPYAARVQCR